MRILSRYELLCTLPETLLNDLVCLTATLFDVPVAMVSLLGPETQELKDIYKPLGAAWQANEEDFCAAAVRRDEMTVLEEMTPKPLELANPFVTRALNFRFYAAIALKSGGSENIGSLCVIGRRSRIFSPTERDVLSSLAAVVIQLLALRQALGPDTAPLTAMWNAIYADSADALHRTAALAERLRQQENLETITAVILRKLICKDANYIAATISQHINRLLAGK